jgi:large subunit ribosomal protein L29
MAEKENYRDMSVEQLRATDEDLSRVMFDLRNEKRMNGRLEKAHLVKQTRRDRARVKTVLREKGGK